jgi:hypothetical protein
MKGRGIWEHNLVCVRLSSCCDQTPGRNNLRDELFILAHSVKSFQSIVMGRAWWRREAHIMAAKKQREREGEREREERQREGRGPGLVRTFRVTLLETTFTRP